jgi:hypothetical protein
MFVTKLFLGFEVTEPYERLLLDADKQALKSFVKNDDTYLQDIMYEDTRYLGKFAGEQTDMASLELLEANIKTLLVKILPIETVSKISLQLFPLIEARRHGRE